MNFAKLIILQPGRASRELEILDDRITIGRALDNTIALNGDTNVSRYHAEIEKRGDDFYLIDLASSNGTTVNDELVGDEILRNEDLICLGGSTLIEFYELDSASGSSHEDYDQPSSEPPAQNPSTPAVSNLPTAQVSLPQSPAVVQKPVAGSESGHRISPLFVAIGVGSGVLLIAIVAVLAHNLSSAKCNPTARIVNPASGTTIREPTTIRVEVEDQQCIGRVIYEIDGLKPISADTPPYEVVLDPLELQDLDSGNHNLAVTVEDKNGKKALQPGPVWIAFEIATVPTNTPSPGSSVETPAPATANGDTVSIPEVRELCIKLAKQFPSNKTEYRYDMEFLSQVQSRTSEYARPGFSQRARPFRDVINANFIDGKNLDEPLGYVLAMSRSGFMLKPGQSASDQGLWQMNQSLVKSAGYSGPCGAVETISDPSQRCAALVAAAYTKALITSLFEGDFVYGVACFSMSPQEAGEWSTNLPQDRADFWKVIRRPEQRDRVVRFFAAGIVGENPEKFNLPQDRKLSSLFPKR